MREQNKVFPLSSPHPLPISPSLPPFPPKKEREKKMSPPHTEKFKAPSPIMYLICLFLIYISLLSSGFKFEKVGFRGSLKFTFTLFSLPFHTGYPHKSHYLNKEIFS